MQIKHARTELDLSTSDTISDLQLFLTDRIPSLRIGLADWETPSLHGMCMFGQENVPDVILLNERRTKSERNFDCAHEFVHIHEHRDEQKATFHCFEKVSPLQDPYLEWQANEGGAELLVPYQDFIPRFYQRFQEMQNHPDEVFVRSDMAEHYQVTNGVIENRLRSLAYEIDQYAAGVPISEIRLLSRKQLRQRNIQTTDYNAVCDFAFAESYGRMFA